MKKLFSKWLPCATLTAWSAILLFFYFTKRIDSLLHPTFRPYTLVAGVVMLALAGCFAFLPVNVEACAEDDAGGRSFGRKTSVRLLTFLILLVPICAAAAFSPGSYSLNAIMNRGPVNDLSGLGIPTKPSAPVTPYVEPPLPTQDGSQPQPTATPQTQTAAQSQPPAPEADELQHSKEGNIIVQVVDLLYAAEDTSLRGDFKDHNIEIIGQLMPDTSSGITSGNRFKLVRMFMVCCAADARPVAVLVDSNTKPTGEDMSWVKVVGKVEFPIVGGRPIAVIKASKVEATEPPEETMLY